MKKGKTLPGIIAVAVIGIVMAGCVSTGDTTPAPVHSNWQSVYDVDHFTVPSLPRGTLIKLGRDSFAGEGLNIADVSIAKETTSMTSGEMGGGAVFISWVYVYVEGAKAGIIYDTIHQQSNGGISGYYVILGKSAVDEFMDKSNITLHPDNAGQGKPDTSDMGDAYVGRMSHGPGTGARAAILNGTWKLTSGENTLEYKFDNGSYVSTLNGVPMAKGSYSNSGGMFASSGSLTFKSTHQSDARMGSPGLYTKKELRAGLVDTGKMTEEDFVRSYREGDNFADVTYTFVFNNGELRLTSAAGGAPGVFKR